MDLFDLQDFLSDLKTMCAMDSGHHNAAGNHHFWAKAIDEIAKVQVSNCGRHKRDDPRKGIHTALESHSLRDRGKIQAFVTEANTATEKHHKKRKNQNNPFVLYGSLPQGHNRSPNVRIFRGFYIKKTHRTQVDISQRQLNIDIKQTT